MADSVALNSDLMCDLPQYGVIEVKGDDARKFLAGLLTGDVRTITPQKGMFTSWCDAKGRAHATFWLMMRGDAFYLVLPKAILESTMNGLKVYLLRVKVALADASGSLGKLGLSGPELPQKLEAALGGPVPTEINATQTLGGCTLMAVPGATHPRWLVLGDPAALAQLRQGLTAAGTAAASPETWTLLDILAGVPLLTPETTGEYIPQMLNMEALGGLSFNKGCYPGQEVIARLHYRGQLKRQLYRATLRSYKLPAPGSKLHGPGQPESVGAVLSAALHPDGYVTLLTVLKIEEKNRAPVHLDDEQGPRLAFID